MDDFYKQKLVWTPVNSEYKFTIIPENYFFNNSIFMITGEYSIMAEPVIPGSRTTLIPVARAIYSIV